MNIIIIGAGRQARIVYEILSFNRSINIIAFVDNVSHAKGDCINNVPVLGDHSVIPGLMKDGVRGAIIAIGTNKIRASVYAKISGMGLEMINAIHPTAYISAGATLGNGISITTQVVVNDGAKIGDGVIIGTRATIDHECEIGDYVNIGQGCSIGGRAKINKGTTIGIGSIIGLYVNVGKNVVIGEGSVILEDVEDNVILERQRRTRSI
jgi:sugar O-acyltransferase (sialic acid O-acetyltransferase NeuD family)